MYVTTTSVGWPPVVEVNADTTEASAVYPVTDGVTTSGSVKVASNSASVTRSLVTSYVAVCVTGAMALSAGNPWYVIVRVTCG